MPEVLSTLHGLGGGLGASQLTQTMAAQRQAQRIPQKIRTIIEFRKEKLQAQLEKVNRLLGLLDENNELEDLMGDIEIY